MDRFALKIALLNAFAYIYPVCMATYVDSQIDHVIYGYRYYWMGYWVALGFIFPFVFTYIFNRRHIKSIYSKIDYSARWKALLTFLSLYVPIIVVLVVNFGPEYPHLAISTNSLGYGLLVALLVYAENYEIKFIEDKDKLRSDHITWLVFSAFSLVAVIMFFLILYDAFPELSQQYTNSLDDQVRLFNSFVIDLFVAIIFAIFTFIRLFQKAQQFNDLLRSSDQYKGLINSRAYDINDLTWDSIARVLILSSIIIGAIWFLFQRNFEPLLGLLGFIYIYVSTSKKNKPEGLQMAAPPPPNNSPQFNNSIQLNNLPHNRNRSFAGRQKLLDKLQTALKSDPETKAIRTHALVGLDGVGKTQIALEYAYRHIKNYHIMWWIRSEKLEDLAADYAELASHLGLPEKDYTNQKLKIEAVKRWLEDNTCWLLVFDNAQKPSELKSYLPTRGAGGVIITSRNSNWETLFEDLEVQGFEREESIEFLISRTKENNRERANDLAEALGDLPLALEQAGAFINERRISLKEYLERFRSRSINDKNPKLLELGGKLIAYDKIIVTTWSISIEEATSEVPVSLDLLNLCSFLDPDRIPLTLLFRGAENLPEPLASAIRDERELDDAIKSLKRYSLINITENGFSMHRLTQALIIKGLSDANNNKWETAAINLMKIAYSGEWSLAPMSISSPR